MSRALLCGFAVTAGVALSQSACGSPCRDIEVKPIDLGCDDNAQFVGELHLDSEAVYDTFLRDQCVPSQSAASIDDAVAAVDFDKRGVFAVTHNRQDVGRCIEERVVETVSVCEDGLRVAFTDSISQRAPCPGRWTVMFSLLRDDLRAALE